MCNMTMIYGRFSLFCPRNFVKMMTRSNLNGRFLLFFLYFLTV